MTTKEKIRRRTAAKRHRNQTPAVIVPPVSNQESNDLKEAAEMKLRPTTETVSDQAAADPTINTEAADDFIEEVTREDVPLVGDEPKAPTNKEMATAMAEAAKAGEFEPDPLEVWFAEKSLALRDWLGKSLVKANDAIVEGWIKVDGAIDKAVGNLMEWSNKTNNRFRNKWSEWFPVKATRDELIEAIDIVTTHFGARLDGIEQMIASKNTVDRGRIDSLLFAVQAKQKVRATKLYASLTGADLATAKEAIEALA